MTIAQTYYNLNVLSDDLNWKDNYLTSECNWLAIAYSCLLLKKYNPTNKLVFYGNESIVNILSNIFHLPYDDYQIHLIKGTLQNKLYCYPKIETYKLQTEPFIHVDCDIFVKEAFPQKILQGNVVAQHLENDITFYGRVYNYLLEHQIELPEYYHNSLTREGIKSYNAGIIGGHNLDFFQKYTQEFDKLLECNEHTLLRMDKIFLMNVVFEQWLLYSLTMEMNEDVQSYYDTTVYNFMMPNGGVLNWILKDSKIPYLHIMEHKRNPRVNEYIINGMRKEFPEYFNKIISEVHKRTEYPKVFLMPKILNKIPKNSTSKALCSLLKTNNETFKTAIKSFYKDYEEEVNMYLFSNPVKLSTLTNKDIISEEETTDYLLKPSPLMRIKIFDKEEMVEIYNQLNKECHSLSIVYNPSYKRNDIFLLNSVLTKIVLSIRQGLKVSELSVTLHTDPSQLRQYINICIVDGIIYCDREED